MVSRADPDRTTNQGDQSEFEPPPTASPTGTSTTLRGLFSLSGGTGTRSKTRSRNARPDQETGVQTGSSLGPPSSSPSSVHSGGDPQRGLRGDASEFFIESARLELNGE